MRRQGLWWSLDKGLVGEFVGQPGRLDFGEFRDPALREYPPLLAATARTAGMTLEERPLAVVLVPNQLYRQALPLTQAGHAFSGDPVLSWR